MIDRSALTEPNMELARIFMLVRPVSSEIFRCSAWDAETRQCRDYDNRPWMCRAFPYNQVCAHCGAGSDAEARGVAVQVSVKRPIPNPESR